MAQWGNGDNARHRATQTERYRQQRPIRQLPSSRALRRVYLAPRRAPLPALPSRSRRRSRATTAVEKPAYIIYVPYRPVPQLDKWLGVEVHLLDGAVMPQWPTQPGLPAVTRTFPRPKPALNPSRTSPHHSPLG